MKSSMTASASSPARTARRCGSTAAPAMTSPIASRGSLRRWHACLYAFDLIDLNGDDLRRDALEVRKATLASIVAKASPGIRFNEHMEGDGPTVLPTPARWA